jgi:small multidrug resistance pump
MGMNAWGLLAITIVLEVLGTTLLKLSDGFSKPWLGSASMLAYGLCFWVLAIVLTRIPVGVTYAIWSGVGIFAITCIGWVWFGQKLTLAQIGYIALILIGVIGLNLTTSAPEAIAVLPQNNA